MRRAILTLAALLPWLVGGCAIPDLVAHAVKAVDRSQSRPAGAVPAASSSPAAGAVADEPPAAMAAPRSGGLAIEELPPR